MLAAPAGAEAGPDGNRLVLDVVRNLRAPEGLLQLPHMESGGETFDVEIPEGLRLSLVDLALTEAVPLAGAEVENRPAPGATGRLSLRVRWSYPVPMGQVAFRLRVYASPEGRPPPVRVSVTDPGSDKRMRALFEQDGPVDLAISGPLAEQFHDQVLARGGEIAPLARPSVTGVDDATVIAIVAVSIAVIAATCIALGLATFGAVLFFAMSKGYNIDDAGYKVAVGEGETRQEHEMVFNIRQP
ncbi:MAG: hypothetical protein KDJ83_03070, partial [Rhodobacteraceae bacterium]|nr:hypothetical protein [Paracoccaceae bacterium]